MKRRPFAAGLAALAASATVFAVAAGEPDRSPDRPSPESAPAEAGPGGGDRARAPRSQAAPPSATAPRRPRSTRKRTRPAAPSPAKRRSPRAGASDPPPRTVLGSIRRARRDGRVSAGDARVYVQRWQRARSALRRLDGVRAAELRAVLGGVERLAGDGRLTAGRMPAVFLEVVRNERFWSQHGPPAAGHRFQFGRDPVVLQYYPGQGLRVQPLATAAEANRLYNACRGHNSRPGATCRKRTLGRVLDRLVDLGARRGDFTAWEYYFPFAGGQAPWISGMAQGTVIQALARGHRFLGRDDGYLDAARSGLGAFETPAPAGVAVADTTGTHYAMYSQQPRLKILNGFLQAISGIQTYARVSGERRAWRLYRAGNAAARRAVPGFDTGGWSLYSKPGGESTLEYHRLVRDFLRNLCRRDGGAVYCRTERRFTGYLTDPPRVNVRPIRGARRGRDVRIRFRVSRNALVTVAARSAAGTPVFRRALRLARGAHEVRWTPRGSQRYRVAVSARDRLGKRALMTRLARVR